MLDAVALRRIQDALVTRAGGYLRNPIRERLATCSVCTTPVSGYVRCLPCSKHLAAHGPDLADAVAPLTYAVGDGNHQAAYMMRGYKATRPVNEHVIVVSMLTWLGIGLHSGCAGTLLGLPVTHWTTVPSLPPKPGEHPFRRIVAASPPTTFEVLLSAAAEADDPREATHSHFTVPRALPPRAHVLILDDTWAKGGHAQSAALAVRNAGAEKVSIMVAARWIKRGYADNERFLASLSMDYDPLMCPWTGAACP